MDLTDSWFMFVLKAIFFLIISSYIEFRMALQTHVHCYSEAMEH